MTALRFSIGDPVWRSAFDPVEDAVTCPDCGGTGRIRCILFDDTEVSIPCVGCARGYDPPAGYLVVYTRRPNALQDVIRGVEVRDGTIEWRAESGCILPDADVFATEAEAMARAEEKAREADAEERRRALGKERPARSWSWHVHYHRREIREGEKRLEWHRQQLAHARIKAKGPPSPSPALCGGRLDPKYREEAAE